MAVNETSRTLDVDGIPVLTEDEAHRLSYEFPEHAEMPKVLEDFLLRKSVKAADLAAVLDGEVRQATADSDEAQQLLLVALRRLRAHSDLR